MDNNWIEKMAEMAAAEITEAHNPAGLKVEVTLQNNVPLGDVFKALKDAGMPVTEVRACDQNRKPLPGETVETTAAMLVKENVLIKTASALYKIAKVELPAGYVGEVQTVSQNHATVKLDANLDVIATTDTGDLCTVGYYIDTVDIPYNTIKVREI